MAKPRKKSNRARATAGAGTVVHGNMELVPVPKQIADEVARILKARGFTGYADKPAGSSK